VNLERLEKESNGNTSKSSFDSISELSAYNTDLPYAEEETKQLVLLDNDTDTKQVRRCKSLKLAGNGNSLIQALQSTVPQAE